MPRAPRTTMAAALVAALLALPACGREEDPSTPADCLTDAAAYVDALAAAPDAVTLGSTPIAECLPSDQPSGDLAEVGQTMTQAASQLAAEAADGDREAAVSFGYLLGVVEVRAEVSSVHYDLGLRIGSEQAPLSDAPDAVREAVAEGLEAGRAAAAA
ncbi:hypothetical protein HJD18_15930 [Thermoleophilia bacterium SCSIO 60948]|nr:hypothetical protein HJD18_15930 [Thermoleophilia bacterium SCSIO 60948]